MGQAKIKQRTAFNPRSIGEGRQMIASISL